MMVSDKAGDDPGVLVPTIRSLEYGRAAYPLHVALVAVKADGTDRVRDFAAFWGRVRAIRTVTESEHHDGWAWLLPPGTRLPPKPGARP